MSIFLVGLALRVLTAVTYRPALEFIQDSFDYLGDARTLTPGVVRPLGYPFFLRVLSVTRHFAAVPTSQHFLGLLTGTVLYLLLRRLGARPWLAALGVAPVLLDPSQVYLEQFVMAETLFQFFAVGALVMLLWQDRPSAPMCAGSGVLLAASALTRTVGLLLLFPAIVYLVVRRLGLRRLVCTTGAAGLLIIPYGVWFDSHHGHLGLEAYHGYFLAGRVLPFADCASLALSINERLICDYRPADQRPGPDAYVWGPTSQLRHWPVPAGSDRNVLAQDFAQKVILDQPGDYLKVVLQDTFHYFAPSRTTSQRDFPAQTLRFSTYFPPDEDWHPIYPPSDPYVWHWTWPGPSVANSVMLAKYGFGLNELSQVFNRPLATKLRQYQRVMYTPGPFLAIAVFVGTLSGLGRLPADQQRLRSAGILLASCGLAVLFAASATSLFDYRYLVPALALLPPGGAIGVLLLERRLRGRWAGGHLPSEP